MNELGSRSLREPLLLPDSSKHRGQRNLQLDVRRLIVSEAKKILNAANLPTRGLQPSLLCLFHFNLSSPPRGRRA
jgi:hypothetical protein